MLNYLDIELPDDARQLQQRVRRFVEDEALPLIPACFEARRFPTELIPRFAELGLLRRHATLLNGKDVGRA